MHECVCVCVCVLADYDVALERCILSDLPSPPGVNYYSLLNRIYCATLCVKRYKPSAGVRLSVTLETVISNFFLGLVAPLF